MVGVLLLPALLVGSPTVLAAPPKAQTWATTTQVPPGGPVLAFAASDTVDSMAVGTDTRTLATSGQDDQFDDDFFAYNFTRGFAYAFDDVPEGAGGLGGNPTQTSQRLARINSEATRVVAASADGRMIAGGATYTDTENVFVMNARTGANWSKRIAEPVTGLALSANGGVLAVSAGDGTTGKLYLFTTGGTGSQVFAGGHPGVLTSVAMSGDGQWIVAGGREVVGGLSYGALSLYHYSGLGVSRVWNATLPGVDDSIVHHVRMSRDGTLFTAVTQAGGILVYPNQAESTALRGSVGLGRSLVTATAMSHDGRAFAVGNGTAIVLFALNANGDIAQRWSYGLGASQPVRALSLSADGTYLAAANGKGFAFHAAEPVPIWTIAGLNDVRGIALSADGARVALADGSRVYAYDATRAFGFGLVTSPGREDLAANYTIRNDVPLSIPVKVRNDGSIAQTFQLGVNASGGIATLLEPTLFTLRPGESIEANLTLVARNAGTGTLQAVVSATAPGAIPKNATLALNVEPIRAFAVQLLGDLSRQVKQGDTDEVALLLANTGNVPATVTLGVRQRGTPSATWEYTLSGADASGVLQVPAKSTTTTRLRILVPSDAPDGARMNVTVSAVSGQTRFSETISYLVNPVTSFESSLDGASRLVEPGKAAKYVINVRNTGTTDAVIRVGTLIEDGPTDLRGWNVNVDEYSFVVPKGKTYKLNVTVTVPGGREPGAKDVIGETLRSVVNLSLADKPLEWKNHTLVVKVKEPTPKPPTVNQQNNVPAPGFGLAGLLLALAAFAARRQGVRRQ
ncbi:MAG TPA: hypothetical protein VNZ52_09070 [Candidatus Thermoplasmatota archaeon]|nr:hypothetical protein [Candidatus Thermoplasmatota archaeon]